MTAALQIPLPLPVLPAGWSGGDKDFKVISTLSRPHDLPIEPVGAHFLAHARRKRHKRTFSEDERIQAAANVRRTEDESDGEISEEESPLLLGREAKDWKGQDHYAVLGLSKLRYRATEDQIKRAHRKKVLKHHPDKKAASGGSEDDNFFKCIQKATEILLDPVKRRQFDSVDEGADVEPPSKKETQRIGFYKAWKPVFESEARFSRNQPVPMLGNDKSTKEEVEHFYDFWYNFDSWRSFEYQDEDVPDDNESRDQRRHIERKNNNARKKKKVEDTARLRTVVDRALELDERIKKFRKEEQQSKNKKKIQREEEEKKKKEEEAKRKEEEAKAAAEKAEKEKAEKADAKKAKDAAKNAVKKNKRVVRAAVKDANYFHSGDGDASAKQIDAALNEVDALLAKLGPDEIADLTSKLNGKTAAGDIKAAFVEEIGKLRAEGKVKGGDMQSLEA